MGHDAGAAHHLLFGRRDDRGAAPGGRPVVVRGYRLGVVRRGAPRRRLRRARHVRQAGRQGRRIRQALVDSDRPHPLPAAVRRFHGGRGVRALRAHASRQRAEERGQAEVQGAGSVRVHRRGARRDRARPDRRNATRRRAALRRGCRGRRGVAAHCQGPADVNRHDRLVRGLVGRGPVRRCAWRRRAVPHAAPGLSHLREDRRQGFRRARSPREEDRRGCRHGWRVRHWPAAHLLGSPHADRLDG